MDVDYFMDAPNLVFAFGSNLVLFNVLHVHGTIQNTKDL